MTRFQKTLEIGDLPAPVAWLDAHAGTIVSILQAPVEYGPEMRPLVSPGQICVHDPITLRPNVLARPRGRIGRARLSRSSRSRLTVCSWPDETTSRVGEPSVVDLWDLSGGTRATRTFAHVVWDAVWWRGRVVLGVSEEPWTPQHGAKVRLWNESLEAPRGELVVNDAGLDVVAAGDVIAASGIDLHVWRADAGERPFSLHESPFAPAGEMGSCAISDDGACVAVSCDVRREGEPQVILLRTNDLASMPVRISDGTLGYAARLAMAPDGSAVAVSYSESPRVSVHRVRDGALLGEASVPGQRAIAWLDASRLLIGSDTLSLWSSTCERRRPLVQRRGSRSRQKPGRRFWCAKAITWSVSATSTKISAWGKRRRITRRTARSRPQTGTPRPR